MPSDQSTWLISVPQGHDPQSVYQKAVTKLTTQAKLPPRNVGKLAIPSFKVTFVILLFDDKFVGSLRVDDDDRQGRLMRLLVFLRTFRSRTTSLRELLRRRWRLCEISSTMIRLNLRTMYSSMRIVWIVTCLAGGSGRTAVTMSRRACEIW